MRRRLFKKFDHISIYFLIAGTYTPFLLVYVNKSFGITLLAVLWGLTAAGVADAKVNVLIIILPSEHIEPDTGRKGGGIGTMISIGRIVDGKAPVHGG
jgi:Haemolysin-III related